MIVLWAHKQQTLNLDGEKKNLSLKLFAFEYGQNSSRFGDYQEKTPNKIQLPLKKEF